MAHPSFDCRENLLASELVIWATSESSIIRFRFIFQMKTIIRTSLKDPQCRLVEVYMDRAPVQGHGVQVVVNLMDSLLTVTSPVSSTVVVTIY